MDDEPAPGKRRPVDVTDITWDKLNITKFNVLGAGMFTGVSVVLYPIAVAKTRLQVLSHDAVQSNVFSVIKGLLKSDGIPGLYRGVATIIVGSIPARILFITTLETTKVTTLKTIEPWRLSQPTQAAITNGVGGTVGSACAQVVYTPMDVVSQRLMVQGYSGHATYKGDLDVIRKIIKSEGIRGLYRGFGLSVMTYSPSNAVWWATYGVSQNVIWRYLRYDNKSSETSPNQIKVYLVQGSGGILSGAITSFISTPLDTIKTRLQVEGPGKKPTFKQVARNLIAEDGLTGLYKGFSARLLSTAAWGTSLILCYEYLKRVSAKDK